MHLQNTGMCNYIIPHCWWYTDIHKRILFCTVSGNAESVILMDLHICLLIYSSWTAIINSVFESKKNLYYIQIFISHVAVFI